jgi:hypothetical protein
MKTATTDTNDVSTTPRTDAFHYESRRNLHPFQYAPLLSFARELERELAASNAEVERLKKMVMEAAELGDKRSDTFKSRAEKAETLLKQIEAFVDALNPTDK